MAEENVETVRRHIEAWNRRDLTAWLASFHPDAELDWSRSRGPLKASIAVTAPHWLWSNPVLHSRGCLRLAQGRTDEGLEDLLELGNRNKRYGQEPGAPERGNGGDRTRAGLKPATAPRGTKLVGSSQKYR
jgi:hypothetical protein